MQHRDFALTQPVPHSGAQQPPTPTPGSAAAMVAAAGYSTSAATSRHTFAAHVFTCQAALCCLALQ